MAVNPPNGNDVRVDPKHQTESVSNSDLASRVNKAASDVFNTSFPASKDSNYPVASTNFLRMEVEKEALRTKALKKVLDDWKKNAPKEQKQIIENAIEKIWVYFHETSNLSDDDPSALGSAFTLDLSGLGLKTIPSAIFEHLSNIKCLDLSENNLSTFDCKDYLPNLEQLLLSKNQLANLEGEYPNLKHLEASDNKLTNIDLGQFENLEFANLNHNQLENIKCTNPLDSLTELALDGNRFLTDSKITEALELMPKLDKFSKD